MYVVPLCSSATSKVSSWRGRITWEHGSVPLDTAVVGRSALSVVAVATAVDAPGDSAAAVALTATEWASPARDETRDS